MNKGIVFCPECREDVEFIVVDKKMMAKLKDVEYIYDGKMAYCPKCNSELYEGEINDFNLKSLYDKYREENGIISLEKILEISSKYNIGKRPLSLLLGWGEHTFSRYCDGDIPTKQYSEILTKIYDEPKFYNEILEKNKNNLKSEGTYRKSKLAVKKLLENTVDFHSKINIVIEYLLSECEDITPLALQKSLYYIQGFYYAFYDAFLFSEECQAWVHGPVYPEIYSRYKNYKFDPIKPIKKMDNTVFSLPEREVLKSVIKYICCYSGKVLEKFTHSEEPWLSTRGNLTSTESSNKIITKEIIGKYFKEIKERYEMDTPDDIKKYAQIMFKRIEDEEDIIRNRD